MPDSSQPDQCTEEILVDTGAVETRVSRLYLKRIGLDKCPPTKLRIHMGGDVYVDDELSVLPNPEDTHPFFIGKDLLVKYKCVLDASSSYLFFNVKNKTYRTQLC